MKHKIKKVKFELEFTVDFDYSDEEFYFNKIECDGTDMLHRLSDRILDDIASKILEDLKSC